jgi:hypothetical protein
MVRPAGVAGAEFMAIRKYFPDELMAFVPAVCTVPAPRYALPFVNERLRLANAPRQGAAARLPPAWRCAFVHG